MRDKISVIRELANAIATQEQPGSLADRLGRAAVTMMDATGASITIAYTTPHRVTLCSTDDEAARLEDLQDVLGQGPGPTAFRTGRQIRAQVGKQHPVDPRWVLWDAAVRKAFPALWLIAIPIRPAGQVLGVLTCHQAADHVAALEEETAQFLADAVGAALLEDPDQLLSDLNGPWAVRAPVHFATGMVVAELGIGPDEALALLRAHAFAQTVPLSTVAAAVIARELSFSVSLRDSVASREGSDPRTGTEDAEGTDRS